MFAVFLPQNVSTCTVEITQYALKGQKLLAQGVLLVVHNNPGLRASAPSGRANRTGQNVFGSYYVLYSI